MLDPQLKKQLAQTIYVASASSVDSYGQASYGAPVAVKARVENDSSIKDDADGEERASSMLIITEDAIALSDRVWLPGDNQADATLARRPISVLVLPDERGNVDHCETRL